MSSGFVSSKELDEERKKRQEEWEKVRKPSDPVAAPEPEVCNKTLFEQLRDNKEAKEAELAEAKKMRNMIRGVDEDESEFLSRVDEQKLLLLKKKKQEEEELLKEMAAAKYTAVEAPQLQKVAPANIPSSSKQSKQASILSAAIKRKATNEESAPAEKVTRTVSENGDAAVSAMKVIGTIPGIADYTDSSDTDSDGSGDDEATLPLLQVSRPEKKEEEDGN